MKKTSAALWIVRVLLILSAVATFGGILEQLRIQQASYAQPAAATGAYTHALRLHGAPHFITDDQESMLGLARNGFYFGFPLLLVLGVAHQIMMVRNSPVKTNYLMRGLEKRLKAAEAALQNSPSLEEKSWVDRASGGSAQRAEYPPPEPPRPPVTLQSEQQVFQMTPEASDGRRLMEDALPLVLGSVSVGRYLVSFMFDDAVISTGNTIFFQTADAAEPSHYDPRTASGTLALAGCFQAKLLACVLTGAALELHFDGGVRASIARGASGESGTIAYRNKYIVF